jgi:hypothetical protein
MNFFRSPWLWGLTGLFLAILGFIFSNKTVYPVWSKFSGVMIVAGMLLVGLSIPVKYNPVARMA